MYKAGEVNISSEAKPLKTKASFMVEDLLRSAHAFGTARTTGCLVSTELRQRKTVTGVNSTKEELKSPETCPYDYSSSRAESYHQADDSSPVSSPNTSSLSLDQVYHLEKVFRRQQYLATKERQRLATTIQATDQQVKKWFQDKRMALKLHMDKAQQRQAKLAYLNSLAQSLLKTQQQASMPRRIVRPAVKCYTHHTQVPFANYNHLHLSSRYTRPERVTPFSFYQPRHRLDSLQAYVVTRSKYHPQVLPYNLS